jgi:UDP-N-acetylglucosamine:LPS N-acetylglucosamine transferase
MVERGEQIENTQAIFLAGRNQELRERISAIARRAPFPTKVIGYTSVMEKLMNAADVMVSKLGGLTTFEAMASRLPIIADTTTPPMPQESHTAHLLSRHNAGVLLKRAGDIAPIIRRLLNDPAEHAAMRLAASRIAMPDATKRIVDELMRKVEERVPVRPPEIESGEYQTAG